LNGKFNESIFTDIPTVGTLIDMYLLTNFGMRGKVQPGLLIVLLFYLQPPLQRWNSWRKSRQKS
jgi:hypothetical protein